MTKNIQKEYRLICDGCNVREPFEHRCHQNHIVVRGEITNSTCDCLDCKEETIKNEAINE